MKSINIKNKLSFIAPPFIAFLLTCIVFSLFFSIFKLYPFGEKSLVWCDLEQQHLPLLLEFKNIVETDGSFLLGKGAGGMNLWGVFFFFISSPFTLLTLVVDAADMALFTNVLTVLKLAVCAFTASVFFRYVFGTLTPSHNIILSLMYAFSGYGMMYYQNNMWLDMMYLFPVLLLSLYRMAYTSKNDLYIIALTLSMVFNYYLSFMNVIFIVIGYGIILSTCRKNNRPKACMSFIIGSAIAALISAVIWIPSILQFTSSGRGESTLSSFAYSAFFNNNSDKFSLLFCTSAIFAGVVLVFVKRKYFSFGLNRSLSLIYFLMLIAVFIEPINNLWHTGSYQAYPLRYGYIVIFLGLSVCAAVLAAPRKKAKIITRKKAVFITVISCIAVYIVVIYTLIFKADKINSYVSTLWASNSDAIFISFVAVFFVISYFFIILFRSKGYINSKAVSVFLALLFVAESFLSTKYYMGNLSSNTSRYDSTVEIAEKIDDDEFFRVETTKNLVCSNMLEGLGFSSLGHYTSLNNGDFFYNAKRLGYSSYWLDSATNGGTLISDALVMNKYIVTPNFLSNTTYDFEERTNSLKIYRNTQMPDGIVITDTAPDEFKNYDKTHRMQTNKLIADKLFGVSDAIREHTPYQCENVSLINDNGIYKIKIEDTSKPASIRYNFFVKNKTELYFDVFSNYSTSLSEPYYSFGTVYVGNKAIERNYPNQKENGILDLGTFQNQYVNVRIDIDKSDYEEYELELNSFGLFSIDINSISNAVVNADTAKLSLDKNKITVKSDKDGWVYIPFNYSDGYTARLDGEKCDIEKALGSFMAVKMKKDSTLELVFYPVGWKAGVVVSILGVILFIMLLIFGKRINYNEKLLVIADKTVIILRNAAITVIYIASVLLWLVLQLTI